MNILKWVRGGVYRPNKKNRKDTFVTRHPELLGVHVTDTQMVASDGFALRASNVVPENMVQYIGKTIVFDKDGIPGESELKLPDIKRVCPRSKPDLTIMLDARRLRELLAGISGGVVFAFRTGHVPVEMFVRPNCDDRLYALLMPMVCENSIRWTPIGERYDNESVREEKDESTRTV